MSTIKVNKIENTSTVDGGIEVDTSGHVTVDGLQMPTAGPLSNRNLLVNGACLINQRQTTPTVGTANTFGPVDHFETRTAGSQWQGQLSQETVSVNNEFTSCLRVKTTTAETTVDGTDQIVVETHMEGQDIQHLHQSTSGAKSITLSFWVRSSRPGTYIVKLYRLDGSAGRQLNKTYTISTSDWEYKTFTFVGDTSGGAIPDTSSEGMRVSFQLAAGSDFTSGTQPTTWTAYSNAVWAAGHSENSFMTTVNATWDVTGVQLEIGEKATPFEHRSYCDELAKCMRYFQKQVYPLVICGMSASDQINKSNWFNYAVPMRATPSTLTIKDNTGTAGKVHFQPLNSGGSNQNITVQNSSEYGHNLRKNGSQTGNSQFIYAFEAKAEL